MPEPIELYRKHRPTMFKQIVGQDKAVHQLEKMVKKNRVPHTILFSGPSGCGKTTLARILKTKLDCSDIDFVEINAAVDHGINDVRAIQQNMNLKPISGPCRIFLLDEVHQMTKKVGGDAQTALLKTLEDVPDHVYFFLCTTDPNQLLKTIITRCTEIKLEPISDSNMMKLLKATLKKENADVSNEICERIVEVSDGSARKALVCLHQVMEMDSEDEVLDSLLASATKVQAIDLARALTGRNKWEEVRKILSNLQGEDAEKLRRLVLGYASSIVLKGGVLASKGYQLLLGFEDNFYDSGYPGLVRASWEVFNSNK